MHAPVYLVRHGQSEWNLLRLTQGQTPHPRLTPLGREQASNAADLLAADLARSGFRSARLVSSDLVRAVETAQVVGERLGLVADLDPRLREQGLGDLEGLSHEHSWAWAEQHDWTDPELPVPGGESPADVRRRLASFLADRDPTVPTIAVSHGDAIRAAIAHLAGHAFADAPWIEVPNGSVARWDCDLGWLTDERPVAADPPATRAAHVTEVDG